MRPNQPSTPSLSLVYTSFQPHAEVNTNNHNTNDIEYYSPSSPSSPTSLLSSTTAITSTSYTFSSSPNSPSLSAVQPQHIRKPHLISDKLNISHSHGGAGSETSTGTTIILRRRPSNIDILLQQEHSRASIDAIERQGLELLEPRPVDFDPVSPVGISPLGVVQPQSRPTVTQARLPIQSPVSNAGVGNDGGHGVDKYTRPQERLDVTVQMDGLISHSQPRFVMGGIFETMEGRG
ncbi:uncharacterized protein BDW70DRAFT_154938 [Aspergillus foveolatus]|uniref:uncharacterized protein n=1 Tax=Aspergillus foveolatus TaxID=210207 RepID=UPI003CCD9796